MLLLFWKGQAALSAGIACTEAPDTCAVTGGEVAAAAERAYPPPAGRSRKRNRRKVLIEDRAYWVTDAELPQLLLDTLRREPPPRKARKSAKAAPAPSLVTPQTTPQAEHDGAARWEAVRAAFEAERDAAALAAWARARRLAEEEDEQDVEMLLLAA